jgi:hypothetical protein
MSWTCPHCGTVATLQAPDIKSGTGSAMMKTAPDNEGIALKWHAVKCPSKKCGKYVLDVWAKFATAVLYQGGSRTGEIVIDDARPFGIGHVRFEPRIGLPLSAHVPKVVKDDYEEACLIKDLSPKAAATLCRRALQGMVRSFWGVSLARLADELKAIEPNCDPDLYKAMMSLKGVGNIGAHPERDVNLIVDVEEGEVETLLKLLHILDREWFVAKARRAENLAAVIGLGATKAAAQKPSVGAAPARPAEP